MDSFLPCHCHALRQATRVVTGFYDDQLRPLGLRISQYSMLRTIEHRPGIATGAVGEALDVDQTTVSRALATLQRSGWAVSTDGEDRRQKHWTLTPRGRALIKKAQAIWLASQNEVEERLGRDGVARLRAATAQVINTIPRL